MLETIATLDIDKKISDFAKELEKNIRIKELYLFGSYANGENNEDSDIDIAVVSDDFSGIRHIDYDKFIDAILKTDSAIEPIAFTTNTFNEDNLLVREILKKSKRYI